MQVPKHPRHQGPIGHVSRIIPELPPISCGISLAPDPCTRLLRL
jgi:hypothetical protein